MYQRMAKALLEDVCHPVSALVSLDEVGGILHVHLFDTLCCGERMHMDERACELWLMCNHDCGETAVSSAEKQNLCRVMQMARGRRVRLFFASEYWACTEADPIAILAE